MAGLFTGNGLPNVVVTDVAMSTTLATGGESTWKSLVDNQSGIDRLTDSFVEEYDVPVHIGGHLSEEFDSQLPRVELPGCRDGSGHGRGYTARRRLPVSDNNSFGFGGHNAARAFGKW
jgi:3-oxoacyl-(acyl-carrier-protein) synthase